MADGASSSGGGAGGGGEGRGETVVVDHGQRRSSCGYCRSTGFSSISHGLWAHSITVDDYQDLLDRGWRRSGCFLYKPDMEKTCCPSYTIRLKAVEFTPSKEQIRVHKKMQRFLDGSVDLKKPEQTVDAQKSSEHLISQVDNGSSNPIPPIPTSISKGSSSKEKYAEDPYLHHLAKKIEDALTALAGTGECLSHIQLPKAVVKKVTSHTKRKLSEVPEDLLYTSSISFQIAAALRRTLSTGSSIDLMSLSAPYSGQNGNHLDISPNRIAEKLAVSIEGQRNLQGLSVRACNGHLNFYSTIKLTSPFACTEADEERHNPKHSCLIEGTVVLQHKRQKLEVKMKQSSFDMEEFSLYRTYQIKVHGDKPEKVTESSYRRFLVDSPLISVPPCKDNKTAPPCGFGSFHQQYLIDGKLVAVGVVDILPRCLSSKYLFWDPELASLSLGKYSALQEIDWVKEMQIHCPGLQYYYLGYYIHSCSKMRYKAAYRPSELLCPLRYEWVPFDIARLLLDKQPYVILSNYKRGRPSSLPNDFTAAPEACPNHDCLNKASSDDDEDKGEHYLLHPEGSNARTRLGLGQQTGRSSASDNLKSPDISNIMIDLNGMRVKFKELDEVFGPIDERNISLLQMQLQRYIRAVGEKLAERIVYALG